MLRNVLLVGVGGFAGTVARYLVAVGFMGVGKFPYATLIVNISGCFLIGVFVGLAERFDWLPEVRLFLAVGLCGGFTTFSAFSIESVRLLQEKDLLTFGLYSAASFVLGILATFLGLAVTKS